MDENAVNDENAADRPLPDARHVPLMTLVHEGTGLDQVHIRYEHDLVIPEQHLTVQNSRQATTYPGRSGSEGRPAGWPTRW